MAVLISLTTVMGGRVPADWAGGLGKWEGGVHVVGGGGETPRKEEGGVQGVR